MEPNATEPAAPSIVVRFSLSAADAAAITAATTQDPPSRARHLTETWYDTSTHTLLRHGLALSTAKARRFHTQTLSQGGISVTAPETSAEDRQFLVRQAVYRMAVNQWGFIKADDTLGL